jgi:hypothetical protein
MARAKKMKSASEAGADTPALPPTGITMPSGGETTGKYVIIFKDDVDTAKVKSTLSR